MFIKIFVNYRGERTQGECVVRANGPEWTHVEHVFKLSQEWIPFHKRRIMNREISVSNFKRGKGDRTNKLDPC